MRIQKPSVPIVLTEYVSIREIQQEAKQRFSVQSGLEADTVVTAAFGNEDNIRGTELSGMSRHMTLDRIKLAQDVLGWLEDLIENTSE